MLENPDERNMIRPAGKQPGSEKNTLTAHEPIVEYVESSNA